MAKNESVEPSPASSADPVLITRYPNRRLYDRSQARYVTLPEIAEMVRKGAIVTVRDSKTGEDLTRAILTQIILEHYPERMELFPVSVLSSIINANETAHRFLRDYLQQSLSYLEMIQQPAAVNPLLLPLHWMRSFLPNPAAGPGAQVVPQAPVPPAAPPAPPAPPAPAMPPAEVHTAALLRRIGELERRLDAVQTGHRTRPRKGKLGEQKS
jgi:polyhydroxyalkanoate synthesis repressor PhaR